MKSITVVSLAVAVLVSGTVVSAVNVEQNHETLETQLGEDDELICTADVEKNSCSFVRPDGVPINVLDGVKYDGGRILAYGNSDRDCGIRITSIQEQDNGVWKCRVGTINQDGELIEGLGQIQLVVAVPPSDVFMRVDGTVNADETLPVKMEEGEETRIEVDCVAAAARPKPVFKWYIGQTDISESANIEGLEENAQADGKTDYVSRLTYFASTIHNNQDLKCVVEHGGFTEQAREEGDGEVSKTLELFFKPTAHPTEQIFYGLKEGQQETITIKFTANPKPETGEWTIAGLDSPIPFGAASLDQKYTAGFPEDGEVTGEYTASLTLSEADAALAGRANKLTVTNDEGTTEYKFKLQMGERPPAEPLGSGPVIGVIVVVIIVLILVGVAVVARSKGALCFAAKNGEQLQEEKDAAAFDHAEKGEPLNPSPKKQQQPEGGSAPEAQGSKPEGGGTAPVATTEAEEKKSNGAHTPV